jgi:putative transposase
MIPKAKGKIERFFRTVRLRFIPLLTEDDLKSIDSLNKKFNKWLEVDYHRKKHLGLDRKPLDVFMEQINRVKMCTDPKLIEKAFYARVQRKVHNAGTISLDNSIYEVPGEYIGEHVEVRYNPENLDVVYIYLDDLLIHTASKVDFEANAKAKRTSFSNFSEN